MDASKSFEGSANNCSTISTRGGLVETETGQEGRKRGLTRVMLLLVDGRA